MKRMIALILALLTLLPLLTACGDGTGESLYRKLIVEPDYFDLKDGTFTEEEHCCTFIISGISERDAERYDDILTTDARRDMEVYFGEEHDMAARIENGNDSGFTTLWSHLDMDTEKYVWFRLTFYKDTMVAVIGDEIPTESECWAMAGVPEDLIPEPVEDHSLLAYVPRCDTVTIANNGNYYGGSLEEGLRDITLINMTMDQVNDYIQAALDMGYVEEGRGTHVDTSVETIFFLGRTADNVTLDLYYCGGYAEIQINAAGRYSDPAARWQRLAAHTGKLMGDYEEDRDLDMMMWVYWEELIAPYILDANYGTELNRGNGLTTRGGGYLYRYCVEANEADYNSYIAEMEALGYTLGVEDSAQDGTYTHTACRECDYNGETFWLWEVIRLEGDFLFCSVGFAPMDAEYYPTDPRLVP